MFLTCCTENEPVGQPPRMARDRHNQKWEEKSRVDSVDTEPTMDKSARYDSVDCWLEDFRHLNRTLVMSRRLGVLGNM